MNTVADKTKELVTSISLVNDKLHFQGTVDGNQPVSIDYTPPLGDNLGYTSLELLLLSLSSCLGSSVLSLLRRMEKSVAGCEIRAHGTRRTGHPTSFERIVLEIDLHSADTAEDDLEKVLKLSEDKFCPVWDMVKGNVEIALKYQIIS